MAQGALAGPGGAHDQYLLPGVDLQVDIEQRGFLLAEILEAEVLEGNDGFFRPHILLPSFST